MEWVDAVKHTSLIFGTTVDLANITTNYPDQLIYSDPGPLNKWIRGRSLLCGDVMYRDVHNNMEFYLTNKAPLPFVLYKFRPSKLLTVLEYF